MRKLFPGVYAKQRGIAVLGTSLIMLVVMGLFVLMLQLMTLRHLETETVKYHGEQAFQAAEAGLAYGMNYLKYDDTHQSGNLDTTFSIPLPEDISKKFPMLVVSAELISNANNVYVYLVTSVVDDTNKHVKRTLEQKVSVTEGAIAGERSAAAVVNSWRELY
jgi:Tfp pilus assembly protein PilX